LLIFTRLLYAQETGTGDIPFKQDDAYSYGFLGRVMLVTLICLGLAVGVAWVLRRTMFRGSANLTGTGESVQLRDHKRLTPKISVYVLEIDRQRVAIVQSGDALLHIPLRSSDE
jgi:flagellar biogenesis protein FliO